MVVRRRFRSIDVIEVLADLFLTRGLCRETSGQTTGRNYRTYYVKALLLLSDFYEGISETKELALGIFKRIKNDPQLPIDSRLLGYKKEIEFYFKKSDLRKAKMLLKEMMIVYPLSFVARAIYVEICVKNKLFLDEAIRIAQEELKVKENDQLKLLLGIAYFEKKNYSRAMVIANQLLAKDPQNDFYLNFRNQVNEKFVEK